MILEYKLQCDMCEKEINGLTEVFFYGYDFEDICEECWKKIEGYDSYKDYKRLDLPVSKYGHSFTEEHKKKKRKKKKRAG